MSLSIKRNGDNFVNFINAHVAKSMENVCGDFAFQTSVDEENRFPIKMGDSLEIFADDKKILTGFNEKLNVSYDDETHNITISGRGKLCDFVDSTTTTSLMEFQNDISLVDIGKLLLVNIGMDDVDVIDAAGADGGAGSIRMFEAFDIESLEIGQSAFEFFETLARKRQVLINSDANGNMVLTRGSNILLNAAIKNKINGVQNNILFGNLMIDQSKMFHTYIAMSQLNPANLTEKTNHIQLSAQISVEAVNDQIRNTRQLIFNTEENGDGLTANDRAVWESNYRRANSISYSTTVQGHLQNGILWEPNKLVQIDDDFAGVSGRMLLKEVLYSDGVDEGSNTNLIFTNRDAYSLQSEEDARDANTDDAAGGWY